jgi:ferrous iron transport protein A
MEEIRSLRQLEPGQKAVIEKVTVGAEMGRRIRDMGLVPGTWIQVLGRAPLKDPVKIKLSGCNLTLRNNEADHIRVRLGGDES